MKKLLIGAALCAMVSSFGFAESKVDSAAVDEEIATVPSKLDSCVESMNDRLIKMNEKDEWLTKKRLNKVKSNSTCYSDFNPANKTILDKNLTHNAAILNQLQQAKGNNLAKLSNELCIELAGENLKFHTLQQCEKNDQYKIDKDGKALVIKNVPCIQQHLESLTASVNYFKARGDCAFFKKTEQSVADVCIELAKANLKFHTFKQCETKDQYKIDKDGKALVIKNVPCIQQDLQSLTNIVDDFNNHGGCDLFTKPAKDFEKLREVATCQNEYNKELHTELLKACKVIDYEKAKVMMASVHDKWNAEHTQPECKMEMPTPPTSDQYNKMCKQLNADDKCAILAGYMEKQIPRLCNDNSKNLYEKQKGYVEAIDHVISELEKAGCKDKTSYTLYEVMKGSPIKNLCISYKATH